MTRKYGYNSAHSARQIERILAALKEQPMTCKQLAAKLHLCVSSVQHYAIKLRESPRKIHIKAWESGGGRRSPIYALGCTKDAVEPPKVSRAAQFAKLKADEVEYKRSLAVRRAQNRAKGAPVTWLCALM